MNWVSEFLTGISSAMIGSWIGINIYRFQQTWSNETDQEDQEKKPKQMGFASTKN